VDGQLQQTSEPSQMTRGKDLQLVRVTLCSASQRRSGDASNNLMITPSLSRKLFRNFPGLAEKEFGQLPPFGGEANESSEDSYYARIVVKQPLQLSWPCQQIVFVSIEDTCCSPACSSIPMNQQKFFQTNERRSPRRCSKHEPFRSSSLRRKRRIYSSLLRTCFASRRRLSASLRLPFF
jgi:hypothetical protein